MIKINDRYSIRADDLQYVLEERKVPKKEGGKEYNATIGYFPSIKMVLSALIRMAQREEIQSKDMTLKEAVVAFKRIEEETKAMLQEHLKEGEGETKT